MTTTWNDGKNLKIAAVQHPCGQDRDQNYAATVQGIREAATQGARLVLLPELHAGVYFCQTEETRHFDQAEPVPGPGTERLGAVAREHGIVIVASLFERRAPGLHHNTAAVIEADGRLAGIYRKMHIPQDPGFQEKFYFAPGDLGFRPIETSVGSLGVLVCWDQWYPEAARLMALHGADLLLYPTAIGWDPRDDAGEKARQREAWITVQRGHAIANGLPVAACNRTGFEPRLGAAADGNAGIDFWGSSFIAGPQGEILAEAPSGRPAVIVAEVNPRRAEDVRRIWPFLRDRRIDAYDDLLRRYGR